MFDQNDVQIVDDDLSDKKYRGLYAFPHCGWQQGGGMDGAFAPGTGEKIGHHNGGHNRGHNARDAKSGEYQDYGATELYDRLPIRN